MTFVYEYARPCVTVDVIVSHHNKILLIKRGKEPFNGYWALPGGFVDMHEDLETAASRELKEETGLDLRKLTQFRAYGKPERDPRHRTISVVYYAVIERVPETIKAGDDADEAAWFDLSSLPNLAFDHKHILADWEEYAKITENT